MRPYFEKMTEFGRPLSDSQKAKMQQSVEQIREVEKELAEAVERVKNAGLPAAELNLWFSEALLRVFCQRRLGTVSATLYHH